MALVAAGMVRTFCFDKILLYGMTTQAERHGSVHDAYLNHWRL
jgi:hypothetical protein